MPGFHLLAVFEHEAQAALAQMAVDAKTSEHKAALQLLDMIDVQDKVITGDAAFCQRDLSGKIAEKKGLSPAGQGQSAAAQRRYAARPEEATALVRAP